MKRATIRWFSIAVTAAGAMALAQPAEASTAVAFSCRTFCLDECPYDQYEFCANQGCETPMYNCAPFGICDAAMYCGTP